jgi:short subunit dehydrogenase-like uncharacterized protein
MSRAPDASRWMIYGAYGYTGELIARKAVERGHRPTLAGRDARRLVPLAEELDLPHAVVSLDDQTALDAALAEHSLVFHAAGPFSRTAKPMIEACLRTRTHYVDVTGEASVIEQTLARDEDARQAGVLLLSAAGFDVVPTDCAALRAAELAPGATSLELAFAILGGASAGTVRTAVEAIPTGVLVRREGSLVKRAAGSGVVRVPFASGSRAAVPMSWGDLASAHRTTGIPNVTVYMAMPRVVAWLMRIAVPVIARLLRIAVVERMVQRVVAAVVRDPPADTLGDTTSLVWARASGGEASAEVALEMIGSYPFTAECGVRVVERILASPAAGAPTPASFLGADFVLEIPGTRRTERETSLASGSR